jgi:hypothetical protein
MQMNIVLDGMYWPILNGDHVDEEGETFLSGMPVVCADGNDNIVFVIFSDVELAAPFMQRWGKVQGFDEVAVKYIELDDETAQMLYELVTSNQKFQLVIDPDPADENGTVQGQFRGALVKMVEKGIVEKGRAQA